MKPLWKKFNEGLKVKGKKLYPELTFNNLSKAQNHVNRGKSQYPDGTFKIKKLGKKTYGTYSRVGFL